MVANSRQKTGKSSRYYELATSIRIFDKSKKSNIIFF